MALRPTRSRRPLLFGLMLGLVLAACGGSGPIIYAPSRGARAVPAPARTQPGTPFTGSSAGNFGQLASTVGTTVGLGTNRQMQFGFRLNF